MMMENNKRVKTPLVLQMEACECGAAALAMVLAYYKLWLPLEQLRRDCGISRDGSKAKNILKAARKYNCEAYGYRWPAELLKDAEYPIILHWEFSHFLVLEGIEDGKVYLNDPALGRREVDWEEFVSSYTGIALVIKPGKEFKPAGEPARIVKRLVHKLCEDKWSVAFVGLISLAVLVPSLASTVTGQIFLDEVLTRKHADWMFSLMVAMFLTMVVTGILTFLRAWCLTRWNQRMTFINSADFFTHTLKLPMDFFNQRYSAEVASRVGFASSIASFISGSAATAALDFLVALLFLLLLFQYSIKLTLIGLIFSLINLGVFLYIRRRMTELQMRNQQYSAKAFGVQMNGLQMIETIKANGNEADLFSKIIGYEAKVQANAQEVVLTNLNITMVPQLLAGVNSALIMLVGGFSIMEGVMTAGVFMAFQNLMGDFQEPFGRIVGLTQNLQSVETQMQRMDDVRNYEIDRLNYPEEPKSFNKSRLSGEVELKDVSFGYSELEAPILKGISFTIKPGRWVAVIGASGSGKSTLGRIITGLYKEWSGEILFDGVKREDLPHNVIVNSVSAVEQDVFQISGTIRQNITLFDDTIPLEDVMQAAKDACLHDEILKLKGTYDSLVSEGGSNFSGGQRQRLEIARALAGNPSFLVLDEATSSLDPITEFNIIRNIRHRGCSCLVVAHRLSTIRDCDEIIVLDHGVIVERGRHDKLIMQDGPYSRLIKMQTTVCDDDLALGGDV